MFSISVFSKFALALGVSNALSFPVNSTSQMEIAWITLTSVVDIWETSTQFVTVDASQTPTPSLLLLMPPAQGPLLPLPPPTLSEAPTTKSMSQLPSELLPQPLVLTRTDLEVITDILTVTAPASTITVSAAPSTVIHTVSQSPSPPSSTSIVPSIPKSVWSAPAQMTDISSFNVSAFPGGQRNLAIVNGIPVHASVSSLSAASEPTSTAPGTPPIWDNSTSVLQLLYPAKSINPAQKPQGGAEFYATPMDLAGARNVTLEYSVFFPADFDWVLAGKLPGLYGGHTGCSGGNDALTCFSTRLMWRNGGSGELYLYAPKAKQTVSLCSDPQSVCDAVYGFSIGRGSFTWTAGRWTNVKQTVSLNTPGKQDGTFTLEVNGRQAIHRADIFYRDIPQQSTPPSEPPPSEPTTPAKPKPPADTGGLLEPLLGGLFRRSWQEVEPPSPALPFPFREFPLTDYVTAVPLSDEGIHITQRLPRYLKAAGHEPAVKTSTSNAATTVTTPTARTEMQSSKEVRGAIGFTGLFFSTFFGGHGPQYATPRDQYVWFKDFGMRDNS